MVDRDLIAAKLVELAARVARVAKHRKPTADALSGDEDALDLVSFNLMVAVQTCADVASHLIADEGWPAPVTLADAFEQLAVHSVLETGTAEKMKRAVGLRNVVAHGYGAVDAALVHAASHDGLDDLDRFAREVAAFVTKQTAPTD